MAVLILSSCQPSRPPQSAAESPVSLGAGSAVTISPDGRYLLVVRALTERNEGWLVRTDGQESYKLFDFDSTYLFAAFSPDSKSIAWSTGKLWLADLGISQPRVLLGDDANSTGVVAWKPDGSELAVELSGELIRIDRQGQVVQQIVTAESIRGLSWVKLNSGEELLVYNSFPADAPPFIATITPSGSDSRRLSEGEVFAVADDRLFYANPSSNGSLAVVDVLGETGKRVLVDQGVTGLAPRPTTFDTVAYVQQSGDIANDLWITSTTGGTASQLTRNAPVLGPLWSPDGRVIYYSAFNIEAAEEEEPFAVFRLAVP